MKYDCLFAILSVFVFPLMFFLSLSSLFSLMILFGGSLMYALFLTCFALLGLTLGMFMYSLCVAFDVKLITSLIFVSLNLMVGVQGIVIINSTLLSVMSLFTSIQSSEDGISGGAGSIIDTFQTTNVLVIIGIVVISSFFIYIYESIVSKNKKGLITTIVTMIIVFVIILLLSYGFSSIGTILSSSILGSIV